MPRDPMQARSAIELANDVRVKRARLKRELARGREHLGHVLTDPPLFMLTAEVFKVLTSAPGMGEGRARRILHHVEVSEKLALGQVTARKRKLIVDTIAAELPGVWRAWEAQAA